MVVKQTQASHPGYSKLDTARMNMNKKSPVQNLKIH